MPKYPLVAFTGGTLVGLLGESNFWDYVRKKWQIPSLREKYMRGEITREGLFGEYKFWQQKAEAGYMRDAEVAITAFSALNDQHKEHPVGDTIGSRVMGWVTVRY